MIAYAPRRREGVLLNLDRILDPGWLRPGAILVADNIKLPGAPDYRERMRAAEGREFRTIEHQTHAEYQTLMKDLVLESEYLAPAPQGSAAR